MHSVTNDKKVCERYFMLKYWSTKHVIFKCLEALPRCQVTKKWRRMSICQVTILELWCICFFAGPTLVIISDLQSHAYLVQQRRILLGIFGKNQFTIAACQIIWAAHEKHLSTSTCKPLLLTKPFFPMNLFQQRQDWMRSRTSHGTM